MKKSIVVLAAVFYLAGGVAHAQSLGEFAREEQKRREGISADRVTTIYGPPPSAPAEESSEGAYSETENPQDADAGAREEASDFSSEKAGRYEITDLHGNPESYWRKTMSDARNKVNQLEEEAKELTSRRNALQLQHGRASGTRRNNLRNEINKTALEQDANRKNLEEAQKELQSLQREARSSGALPGWLR